MSTLHAGVGMLLAFSIGTFVGARLMGIVCDQWKKQYHELGDEWVKNYLELGEKYREIIYGRKS